MQTVAEAGIHVETVASRLIGEFGEPCERTDGVVGSYGRPGTRREGVLHHRGDEAIAAAEIAVSVDDREGRMLSSPSLPRVGNNCDLLIDR